MRDLMTETLLRLLKRDYQLALPNIVLMKSEADIIFTENDLICAVFVRPKASDAISTISLCAEYQAVANKTFIALPENEAKKADSEIKILNDLDIGVISFSKNNYAFVSNPESRNHDDRTQITAIRKLKMLSAIMDAADVYKALGHPMRLQIYLDVRSNGTAKLKDVADECGGCYPLIMKHISILEEANLIDHEKRGKETTLKLKSVPVTFNEITQGKTAKTQINEDN